MIRKGSQSVHNVSVVRVSLCTNQGYIALEGAFRRSGVQRTGTIKTKSLMLLGFAGDIDLIDIDRRTEEEAYAPLKGEAARIGLTINSTKTRYKIVDRGQETQESVVSDKQT